ncbi:MAG: transposase, partial [Gemmatimonadaceae bacterium]|nr:transposase [Gemmatimonadaceae bacterium]
HSSGGSVRRGAITKTGNAHLRRVLVEAGWAYRRGPATTGALRHRQADQPPGVVVLATKAQHRLCHRYRTLVAKGKPPLYVATLVARELLGFIWASGRRGRSRHGKHRGDGGPPPRGLMLHHG